MEGWVYPEIRHKRETVELEKVYRNVFLLFSSGCSPASNPFDRKNFLLSC